MIVVAQKHLYSNIPTSSKWIPAYTIQAYGLQVTGYYVPRIVTFVDSHEQVVAKSIYVVRPPFPCLFVHLSIHQFVGQFFHRMGHEGTREFSVDWRKGNNFC